MSVRAHLLVLVLTGGTLAFILRQVRRQRLRAKYSVLWVSLGAGLAVLASAPTLLERSSHLVGIRTPALMFLLMALTFLLVLSLHFSWELSRLEDRTRRLAEECALLRERLGRPAEADAVHLIRRAAGPLETDHPAGVGGGEGGAEPTGPPMDS